MTRSIICDLILFFFLSLNIVPLIGSDCPSQSRDAILVVIETTSASAGQACRNVAATFLGGCHNNAGWTRADNESYSTSNTSVIAGSRIQIWLIFFSLIKLFSSNAVKLKLTGALVCFFFLCQINIYIFFFIEIQAKIDNEELDSFRIREQQKLCFFSSIC